jgi:hypothetical protein
MIHRFVLRDFKGHRDTQLELGRFAMLVGDNASGKTSVLDALSLQASFGDNPVRALRDSSSPEDLLRRSSEGPITIHSEGTRSSLGWKTSFVLQVKPSESDKTKVSWELQLQGQLGGVKFDGSASGSGGGTRLGAGWDRVTKALGATRIYRLSPNRSPLQRTVKTQRLRSKLTAPTRQCPSPR